MEIKLEVVGNLQENTYFVIEEQTKDSIIIDPGAESDRLISIIEKENLNLKCIILTHAHFDHIGACKHIKEKFDCPLAIGKGEEILLENDENNLSKVYGNSIKLKADKYLEDNDILNFGNLSFKIIQTPGHTPGGICLYFEKEDVIFTGDTLFYGSVGRTDLPFGDFNTLANSLKKLKNLPDNTTVFQGTVAKQL